MIFTTQETSRVIHYYQEKISNEIIIFNEQDEPVKLQVVYVLHQNRTIEYNTDIEMKRKEYLKRSRMTQEETISQMVSESIHGDDTQVSKSSRLIGKKILEQFGAVVV